MKTNTERYKKLDRDIDHLKFALIINDDSEIANALCRIINDASDWLQARTPDGTGAVETSGPDDEHTDLLELATTQRRMERIRPGWIAGLDCDED